MNLSKIKPFLIREPINFRSIADLNIDILNGIPRLLTPIDLVIGIPRSGMLPAAILALHLNCDLIDVDGFVNKRVFNRGHSRMALSEDVISTVDSAKSIMVLDDSVYSGEEMANVRKRLAPFGEGKNIIFAAVYVSPETTGMVDFYFKVVPNPRVFEWNLMHHQLMEVACIDMDGVLCRDPTEAENDDGPKYQDFLG